MVPKTEERNSRRATRPSMTIDSTPMTHTEKRQPTDESAPNSPWPAPMIHFPTGPCTTRSPTSVLKTSRVPSVNAFPLSAVVNVRFVPATLIAFALVAVTWFVLWRTTFGLRVRSSGEAPSAAESLGVRVLPLRFAALAVSGAFAGLAGGYLSIVTTDHYQQGQTQSKGYIGLATTIFGNWRPSGVMGGAMLFGFADTLNARGKPESVPSLFILFTFIAGLLIVFNLYRRKATSAAAATICPSVAMTAAAATPI